MLRSILYFVTAFAVINGLLPGSPAVADGPRDNIPDNVRPVPPVGVVVSAEDRAELEAGLSKLDALIESITKVKDGPVAVRKGLLPDVEIFSRAIHQGLKYREFFSNNDVKNAKSVLQEGLRRAEQLAKGEADWLTQKGLVVRGFRSRIDQTVQPYGLVIPDSYEFSGKSRYRLDLWFHGRGEKTSESNFINQRMRQVGRIAPQDTIVLHPYGRYSNAFKFAGEVDVLEALDHAKQFYKVDEDRVAVRGFSMGGAGCWQFAVHYPDLFFAATPGAGFSETPEFLKFFQKESLNPTWYEKQLWHLYDCTDWAVNLTQLPTIAYSGELDIQKQAADIMESTLANQGIHLTHLIGPQTKHTIHRDSLKEIESRLASLARRGRNQLPRELRFVTWTLKYNRMHWLTVTGLKSHWQPARVTAMLLPAFEFNDQADHRIMVKTENVTSFRIEIEPGLSPFTPARPLHVLGHRVPVGTDRSVHAEFYLEGDKWLAGTRPAEQPSLRKSHNLQGPVDDAFMDSFVVVRPTGKARNEAVEKWTNSELKHCVAEWRRQFRGDAIVKDDSEVSKADIAGSNLILFGDPVSNSVIGKVLKDLPVSWDEESVVVGKQTFDAAHHAPVLIYPNPLNPKRYIVINSGFTYREFAYLNNARQVPKLPDWAVIDLRTPADSLWPGKVVAADFFDESWQLKTQVDEER